MDFSKVKWDSSFYVMCLLSIFGGYYTEWLIYFTTILIHECGHLAMAFFMGWKLKELKVFGFGGIMMYEQELNQPIMNDILISLGGILANVIFLLLLQIIPSSWLDIQGLRIYELTRTAHFCVIFLNLIPIPPLDGHRLLLDLMCLMFPFHRALRYYRMITYALIGSFVLITIIYNFRQYWFVAGYLLIKTIEFNREHQYLFQRFIIQKLISPNRNLPKKDVMIKDDYWEGGLYKGVNNSLHWRHAIYDEQRLLKLKYQTESGLKIDGKSNN